MKETKEFEIFNSTLSIKATIDSSALGQKYYDAFKGIEKNLTNLDMNRGGGISQTSGFVFENLDAIEQNINSIKHASGEVFYVIDDNGLADIKKVTENGSVSYLQLKKGYHGTNKYKITKDKYATMEKIVVDKENDEVFDYLSKQGVNVERSSISESQADSFTKLMQKESNLKKKIGINENPSITSNLYTIGKKLQASHEISLNATKSAASFTAGMTMGKNLYFLIKGDMDFKNYAYECAKTTGIKSIQTYATSYTASLVAPVAVSQLSKITIMKTAGELLVKVGAISAKCSLSCGPLFLIGMAAGCAYTGIVVSKAIIDSNRQYLSQINEYLENSINFLQLANSELLTLVNKKNHQYLSEINSSLSEMLLSSVEYNFDKVNEGLSRILQLYNQELLFDNIQDFDDVFFGNAKIKF